MAICNRLSTRIVTVVDGEGRVLITKKWMTKTFVTGDILSFVLQAGGKIEPLVSN
jgi:hypothetical protein